MGFSRNASTCHNPNHNISSMQAFSSPIFMLVPVAELNALEGIHVTTLSNTPMGAEVFQKSFYHKLAKWLLG